MSNRIRLALKRLGSFAVEPAAYESLSGRAKWAQRSLIAAAVLNAVGAVSAFAAYKLYQRALVTQDDLDTTDFREGLIAGLTLLATIVTIVFFIRWFRRAYLNLPALGAASLRFKSWWTIGGWFIPIANLFRPKEIANDIWRASERTRRRNRACSGTGPTFRHSSSGGGCSFSSATGSTTSACGSTSAQTTSTGTGTLRASRWLPT
jgi:hypothetical protein